MRFLKSVLLVAACLSSASSFAFEFASGGGENEIGKMTFISSIQPISEMATCIISRIDDDVSFVFGGESSDYAPNHAWFRLETTNMENGEVSIGVDQIHRQINDMEITDKENTDIIWKGSTGEGGALYRTINERDVMKWRPTKAFGNTTVSFFPVIDQTKFANIAEVEQAGGASTSLDITVTCNSFVAP